jgi:hypothetical protein
MRLAHRSDFAERGTAGTRRAKSRRFAKVPPEWLNDPLLRPPAPLALIVALLCHVERTFTTEGGAMIGLPLNPYHRRGPKTAGDDGRFRALLRRAIWTREDLGQLVGAHPKHVQRALRRLEDPERRSAGLPHLWVFRQSGGCVLLLDVGEASWNALRGRTLLIPGDHYFGQWLQALPQIGKALGLVDNASLHGESETARGSIDAPPSTPTGSVDAPPPGARGSTDAPPPTTASGGLLAQTRSLHGQIAEGLSPGRDKQNESERRRGGLSQSQLGGSGGHPPSRPAPFRHQSDELRRIAEASGLLKQMASDRATEQELARKQESAESDDGEYYRNLARRARDLK